MKNQQKVLLLLSKSIVIIIFAAMVCFAKTSTASLAKPGLVNSSKVISQTYSFAEQKFESIKLAGNFEVEVQVGGQSNVSKVVITTNNNLLPYIKVCVKIKPYMFLRRMVGNLVCLKK